MRDLVYMLLGEKGKSLKSHVYDDSTMIVIIYEQAFMTSLAKEG